jgi:hypothetical protein
MEDWFIKQDYLPALRRSYVWILVLATKYFQNILEWIFRRFGRSAITSERHHLLQDWWRGAWHKNEEKISWSHGQEMAWQQWFMRCAMNGDGSEKPRQGGQKVLTIPPDTGRARSHRLFDDRNISGVSRSFYFPRGKFDMRFQSVNKFIFSSSDFSGRLKIRMDKFEQRIIIKYFSMKGLGSRLIQSELKSVLHHSACSLSAVERWVSRFKTGVATCEHNPRPGQPPPTWDRISQPSFWSFLSPVPVKCQDTFAVLIVLSRKSTVASLAWGSSRDTRSRRDSQMIKSHPGSGLKGPCRNPAPLTRQFFRRNLYMGRIVVLIWLPIWVIVCGFPRSSPAKIWTRHSGQECNDYCFL